MRGPRRGTQDVGPNRAHRSPSHIHNPVLAASVLAKSRFSDRVPSRIKNVSTFHGWIRAS